MDKNVAGLIGAVGAIVAAGSAQAAVVPPVSLDSVMQVSSYSDLLKPIPNATALLKAQAKTRPNQPAETEQAKVVQVQYHHHHHHHHHHHYHHHHHHHHDGEY